MLGPHGRLEEEKEALEEGDAGRGLAPSAGFYWAKI